MIAGRSMEARAPQAAGRHVAAVVLTWNGRDDTLRCLESLERSAWPRLTLVVVDNASTDGTAEAVAARFPGAEIVANDRNVGFAAGMNAGMRRALELGADHLLLLNNDTVVDPGMVGALMEALGRLPDAGALNPLVLYADRPDVVNNAGLRFDPRRGYNGRPHGMGERDRGQFDRVREVDAACATAMLVPAEVAREVGLLDDDLFIYMEDVDWAMRMHAAGRRCYLVPAARLWHRVSVTWGGENAPAVAYYTTRNTLAVCERHAPMRGPRARLRRLETVGANLLHALRARRPDRNLRAVVQGWGDYRRGRMGARP
jgi:GT2 family glycosyltransferase